jgi:choline dehydrogenase-like flavoprotein
VGIDGQQETVWGDRRGRRRMRTLRAVCDTFVAPVRPPKSAAPDSSAFWTRAASDFGTEHRLADVISHDLEPEDRDGLLQLIDALTAMRFSALPQSARAAVLKGLAKTSDDAAAGVDALRALTIAQFYGFIDASGAHPGWQTTGYPGPPDLVPGRTEPLLSPLQPSATAQELTLDADVCVVGSGSGGGVVAGVLAGAGKDVVVLEAGDHHEPHNFPRHELEAYRKMYWRGAIVATADRNVSLLAGATLGGGATINWTNCLPPPAWVREEWARVHGLAGLDGAEFDQHLDAVSKRLGVTSDCSDPLGADAVLRDGAEALGWSWHGTTRNADPETYDPETAGFMGYGDRSGSRQGVIETFLHDAATAGARILVRTTAERVLTEGDRATGVQATHTREDGSTVRVTVRASTVVVACGALETPALLLRSGRGGPAVGHHLRLHPVPLVFGYYPEPQEVWRGCPQAVVMDQFANMREGHGFLGEAPHYHSVLAANLLPWWSARAHKLLVGRGSHAVGLLGLVRERGGGRVSIDERGRAVPEYPLDDEFDLRHMYAAHAALSRIHEAAGATAIVDPSPAKLVWRKGQDLDAWLERAAGVPFGAGGRSVTCAHQMGTARMGRNPLTSVADPEGQLHDTRGVWIGDTSAFPSASGSNPMLTCMALAHRTAEAILAAG